MELLGEIKLPGMNTARFVRLAKVAKVVLTIPHSNAGEKHVFSVIHKIRRDNRGKQELEGTVSSLVTVKMHLPETKAHPCFTFQPKYTSSVQLQFTIKRCALLKAVVTLTHRI